MSSVGAAPRAAVPASNVRAEASRKNGARSRGPKTPEGKTRSAQNALKHGLRAQKYVVLPEEDAAGFAALEAALEGELAPEGALQSILVGRIARAAWRLERAERIEVVLFEERHFPTGTLGLALIRDGNGTRSFETLLRYRGAGGVLALAAHAQGAPGRAGGDDAGACGRGRARLGAHPRAEARPRRHRARPGSDPRPAPSLANPSQRAPRTNPSSPRQG
jgi:hypothetical protein